MGVISHDITQELLDIDNIHFSKESLRAIFLMDGTYNTHGLDCTAAEAMSFVKWAGEHDLRIRRLWAIAT